MKRAALFVFAAMALVLSGCAGYVAPVMPPSGWIYSSVQAPIGTDMNKTQLGAKEGVSSSMSILGAVAMGDASIASAARNGGVTSIQHVDYEYFNVLGVYQKFTIKVHGD